MDHRPAHHEEQPEDQNQVHFDANANSSFRRPPPPPPLPSLWGQGQTLCRNNWLHHNANHSNGVGTRVDMTRDQVLVDANDNPPVRRSPPSPPPPPSYNWSQHNENYRVIYSLMIDYQLRQMDNNYGLPPSPPLPPLQDQDQTSTGVDLRTEMTSLQYVMNNMARTLAACMDMQLELHRSIRQEVSAALNRSNRPQELEGVSSDLYKRDYVKKGICCICCESNIDSLLNRCGHMCTCFKCASILFQNSNSCPICRAPIVEVILAYYVG